MSIDLIAVSVVLFACEAGLFNKKVPLNTLSSKVLIRTYPPSKLIKPKPPIGEIDNVPLGLMPVTIAPSVSRCALIAIIGFSPNLHITAPFLV